MEDRYVCAMRKGHPLAGKEKLTLDDYLGMTHIHISSRRSGLGHVDLALGKMGIQRKIALRSQHYLMASQVLQQTDMVMTVPERFARRNDLHSFSLPVNPPLLARKHRPGPGQSLDARADDRVVPAGDGA
jgi:DNA-binding transcriptional LysR family regulator